MCPPTDLLICTLFNLLLITSSYLLRTPLLSPLSFVSFMFTNLRDNCVHKPLSILAPPIVITALITPSNYTVPYNSSYKAELILQGLPIYNPDVKIVDWRTEITSTIEGQVFVDIEYGYLKLTAQYNLFKCANTGIHRAVLQLKDYSQFEYELPIPLIISGKLKFSLTSRRADFYFSLQGWKNFRWGASHMPYAIPDALEGAGIGKPKCARGAKRNSSGLKHFLEDVKKNFGGGGFNPPNPPENPPMLSVNTDCGKFKYSQISVSIILRYFNNIYIIFMQIQTLHKLFR